MGKPGLLQIGPYPQWDEDPLNAAFDVHRFFEVTDPDSFLVEKGAGIRAVATRGNRGVSNELLAALPNVEIVSVYGVGFDAVDIDYCKSRGIRVTNTPDVLTRDVADLALAMMLAQARGIVGAEQWIRSGDWASKGGYPLKKRVHGAKAGVLGLGRIGFEIARRLAPLDMDIAYTDQEAKPYAKDWTFIADPQELAAHSDFLFVALAATAVTRHIVSTSFIEAVGPEAMIINVSRASNIDEEAMLSALENKTLGSAALDVFEGEPALNPRFAKLENVLLQPHHASGTVETRKDMGKLMRNNLDAHFAGRPLPAAVV